jgi:hypothetical protein
MVTPETFNEKLVEELRRYTVFTRYWSDSLQSIIPDHIKLTRKLTEVYELYEAELTTELQPIGNIEELQNTIAHFTLAFLASSSQLDYERIIDVDRMDRGDDVHTAHVIVRIHSREPYSYSLARFSKRLWRAIPAEVQGDPRYVRLVIQA